MFKGLTNYPKVFVLILTYNGKQWIEDCLPSVLEMDYPEFEAVVIDNGSSDGTIEYLRNEFPTVYTLSITQNVGYARGFNAGLEYAAKHGAEYFLIMNNDTVIDRGALSALVETAVSEEQAGFVTGKVYFFDRPDTLQSVGKYEDPVIWSGRDIGRGEVDTAQFEAVAERSFADDVFILVSRELYETIGGYDPEFFLQCEEMDWQIRAKKRGWRIYFTPSAKIWHRVSATSGGDGSPMVGYFEFRNRTIVLAKHGGVRRFTRYLVWGGTVAFLRLIRGITRLNWTTTKPRLARFLGLLAGVWWLVRRQPSTGVPWLIDRMTNVERSR